MRASPLSAESVMRSWLNDSAKKQFSNAFGILLRATLDIITLNWRRGDVIFFIARASKLHIAHFLISLPRK